MSVAYLIEQGSILSKEGQRLLVKKQGTLLHTIHGFKLEQVVIFGNVSLTPVVISFLLKNGIDTAFMTSRGKYLGRLQSPEGKNILLRQVQYRRLQEEPFILETARAIVKGKLANQRGVLLRINRTRTGINLEEMIYGIKKLMEKADEAASLETLRGYEGKGSALFFKGFSAGFIDEGITFTERIRRPPTDPVNCLLSLGYTLLFNCFLATLSMAGLDPYLGSLHAVDYGRPSLALDLMEEWRPVIVDTLVLSVFNLKAVTEDDFTTRVVEDDDAVPLTEVEDPPSPRKALYLTDSGLRKFLTQYERKMSQTITYPPTGQEISYRDCIREQARHFVRYLKGEERQYTPVQMK